MKYKRSNSKGILLRMRHRTTSRWSRIAQILLSIKHMDSAGSPTAAPDVGFPRPMPIMVVPFRIVQKSPAPRLITGYIDVVYRDPEQY